MQSSIGHQPCLGHIVDNSSCKEGMPGFGVRGPSELGKSVVIDQPDSMLAHGLDPCRRPPVKVHQLASGGRKGPLCKVIVKEGHKVGD